MDPINYKLDVADPFTSVMQGYQIGNAMQQQQIAQQQALAQQQAQQAAAAQMNADLSALAANKNASGADYAGLITKYPQLSEQLKRGWDVMNSGQQQSQLKMVTPIFSALQNGKTDIALDELTKQAEAARNSGDEASAKDADAMAGWIKADPSTAKTLISLRLAATAGPEKFSEALSKIGGEQRAQEQAPFDLAEKKAKAEQEVVKAKYADSVALQDIEKRGWDIKKVVSDIAIDKENARIRAMEASLKREENGLKRQELQQKLDDAKTAREDKIREKITGAESSASTIDNMLNTADRILKNPSLNSVIGSIQGRAPAIFSDEANDAIALIDTLGSQAFLSQIPAMKGTGSLTEREGDKLQASLTNLSRTQSEEQFKYNLKEAQRLMLKARKNLSEKTGVPLGAPDRPNAPKQSAQFDTTPGLPAPATDANQKNIVVDF